LSDIRDYLFSIFATAINIWWPFLHPQPEDAPYLGDRDPLIKQCYNRYKWYCDIDVPLATALCKTFLLRMLDDS
jgi:hypothetical protein